MMILMIWQKHWCSVLHIKCYDGWWWWCDVIHGCGKNNDDDSDGAYDDLYIMVKCVCVCHEKVTNCGKTIF